MARTLQLLINIICLAQVQVIAQVPGVGEVQQFEIKASAIVQSAKLQVMIMTSQLMNNATIITGAAEGNASQLLRTFQNEIQKAISDAQIKASQIGESFQANLTRRADEVVAKAMTVYTTVEQMIRNATNRLEQTVIRIQKTMETEVSKVLETARTRVLAGPDQSMGEAKGDNITDSAT